MKKLCVAIYLIFAVAQALANDTYDSSNGQLTIPMVQVGSTIYSNVIIKLTTSDILSTIVNGGPVVGIVDLYNNGSLTIPSVQVGVSVYTNVSINVSISNVLSVGGATVTNAYFASSPIITPDLSSYTTNLCINSILPWVSFITPVDLNNDGIKDLAIHIWCNVSAGSIKTDNSTDRFITLIQQANGSFSFGNKQLFGSDIVKLGATSRKVEIGDINGDGYQDIFFALNQEDGRDQNSFVPDALTSLVVSQGNGSYKIVNLGNPDYFHSVAKADNNLGGFDIVLNGFDSKGTQAFRYSNGSFNSVNTYPTNFGAFTNKFYPQLTTNSASPKMISGNVSTLTLFTNSSSGQWTQSDTYNIPSLGSVPFVTWQNSTTTVNLLKIGGYNLIGTAFSESCLLTLNPKTDPVFIVNLNANILPSNYSSGTLYQNSLNGFNGLFGFNTSNSKLQLIDNLFSGSNYISSTNNQLFDCFDINKDGYEDIAEYPEGQKPILFINNRNSQLINTDTTSLPSLPLNLPIPSSLMVDIDGDGITDLLYFSKIANTESSQIYIYKGLKNFP